jgi:menaquinone reductase, multiheme cytochrome c subunit
MERFLFPRWVNRLVMGLLMGLGGGAAYASVVLWFATDPNTINTGYQPQQPVPFSHAIHAGQLKMDCRYCHNTVFAAGHAAIPPTATCINCHSPADTSGTTSLAAVHASSKKLDAIHDSWKSGKSVEWIKVHNLPDFVYFNHAAHVNTGVSCVSCHGRIDKMEVVHQDKNLSMAWCLDCHRNPAPHIRPVEFVTKLDWEPQKDSGEDALTIGTRLVDERNIHPKTNCAVCHR